MKPASAPSKKVLIVEDENSIRHGLHKMLQGAGYSVQSASDGVEGLESLEQQDFDLVLLDVWMPRMNGLEVLANLHSRPAPPKVIVMTGDHTPETLLQAVREQAYQYVTKPFSFEAVVDLVGQVLTRPEVVPPIEVLSAKPNWVELLVPCEREVVDRIQSFMMGLQASLPADIRESIGQAFHELLLNAIEWGGQLDPNRKAHIAYMRTGRMILYRIADPGNGFNFENLSHAAINNPAENACEHLQVRERKGMRSGGFGILLTKTLVDELLYNEKQNEVVFVKYLDQVSKKAPL